MYCICCGNQISQTATDIEKATCWHKSCVKKFFGTSKFPNIELTEDVIKKIAEENTNRGYTVPGVQKKLSLHLEKSNNPRLTLVNYPTGYILKPQTKEYNLLPESEYLIMTMAKATGIKTVPFALIKMQDNFAYITKRIDRVLPTTKNKNVGMLAMEDFCQLDGKLTEDKYHGSYERCGKIISKYSARSGLDMSEMFLRIVFSYVVGNSDMHLKNFSLIETTESSREYVLSDSYDMLPVNIILPIDIDEMALTVNGKKKNLRKKDFLALAKSIDLPEKIALNMIKKVISNKETYIKLAENSLLSYDMKTNLINLIEKRISMIQ